MEARARYLLVGVFVLTFLASAILFTLWVAQVQIVETRPAYLIYFTGSVTGLKEGSPVRYRGVPVGKVSEIVLDPTDVERVRVRIHVDDRVPIKADARASLETKGMTGNSFVQISGGTQAAENLIALGDELPVIPSEPAPLAMLLQKAPTIAANLVAITERVGTVLSDRNANLIDDAVANLHRMSVDLATAAARADETMASIRATANNVETLFVELRQETRQVTDSVDQTLARVRVTLGQLDENSKVGLADLTQTSEEVRALSVSIRGLSDELTGFLEESREPFRDFSNVGLYELSRLITETRGLTASLARVSRQIEQSPMTFLFGGTQTNGQQVR